MECKVCKAGRYDNTVFYKVNELFSEIILYLKNHLNLEDDSSICEQCMCHAIIEMENG